MKGGCCWNHKEFVAFYGGMFFNREQRFSHLVPFIANLLDTKAHTNINYADVLTVEKRDFDFEYFVIVI